MHQPLKNKRGREEEEKHIFAWRGTEMQTLFAYVRSVPVLSCFGCDPCSIQVPGLNMSTSAM